jgi:hypothetical protein
VLASWWVAPRDMRDAEVTRHRARNWLQLAVARKLQDVFFSADQQIVFSEALGEDRGNAIAFIKRCQWKGSASPRICEELMTAIWARRDATGRGTWREEMRERSCPFII